MTKRTRLLSLILCFVLTWTAALFMGCTDNTAESPIATSGAITTVDATESAVAETEGTVAATEGTAAVTENTAAAVTKLGEGDTSFTFTVTYKDGKESVFEISTDKATVGEALQELELIEGEEGAYGLYVKKVNGITADYDIDGTYWAFYANGEYAISGVDKTNIENGATYSFKVE